MAAALKALPRLLPLSPRDGDAVGNLHSVVAQCSPGTPRSLTGREAFESLDEFIGLDELGKGTFASVKKVVHRKSGRVFALKTVKRERVLQQGGTEETLAREAVVQLRMRHRNIVQLYGNFDDGDRTHFVLEFVVGGMLLEFMRKERRLKPQQAARMFSDVVSGLTYVHDHGIVHRDIKPENVLLQHQDQEKVEMAVAKIADFGCCAVVTELEPTRNTICGTMDYLAPEMIDQQPHDHRVDVWAVGVLLYEMLVGAAPFKAKSQLEALRRIADADLQCPAYLDASAVDLIQSLLQRDPEMRLTLAQASSHSFMRKHLGDADEAVFRRPVPGEPEAFSEHNNSSDGATPHTPRAAAEQAVMAQLDMVESARKSKAIVEAPASLGLTPQLVLSEPVVEAVAVAEVERRSISPILRPRPMPMSARGPLQTRSLIVTPSAIEAARIEQSRHTTPPFGGTGAAVNESVASHVCSVQRLGPNKGSPPSMEWRWLPELAADSSPQALGEGTVAMESTMPRTTGCSSSHAPAAGTVRRTSSSRLRSLTPPQGDLEETLAGLRDVGTLAGIALPRSSLPESPRISHLICSATPRGQREQQDMVPEATLGQASSRAGSSALPLPRDSSPGRISPLAVTPRGLGGQPSSAAGSLAVAQQSKASPNVAAAPPHARPPRLSPVLAEEEVDGPQLAVCTTAGHPRAKAALSRKNTDTDMDKEIDIYSLIDIAIGRNA